MAFTITADSKPVYDTFGFADYWQCNEWITWHKELVKKYGSAKADIIWADAWVAGVSSCCGGKGTAPGSGYLIDSVPIDCRTFNTAFKDYISKSKVLNDAVFAGALGGTVGKAESTLVNTTKKVFDSIDNVAESLSKTTKALRWAIPVIILITLIVIGIIVYKRYIK